jgi:rifampicin phosphotransferase
MSVASTHAVSSPASAPSMPQSSWSVSHDGRLTIFPAQMAAGFKQATAAVQARAAVRRRLKTAAGIWERREWRIQLEEWKAAKARAVAEHLRLQAVAVDELDDGALAKHFEAVRDHAARMIEQHHTYNLATMVPVGDLLAHATRWGGGKVTDAEVFAVLTGASPIAADLM